MKGLLISTTVGLVCLGMYAAVDILAPGKPTEVIRPVAKDENIFITNIYYTARMANTYLRISTLAQPGIGNDASNFFYHNVPKDWILTTSNYTLRGGQ